MNNNFSMDLREAILRHQSNDWQDNWDFRRFGPYQQRSETIGQRSNLVLSELITHEDDLQWLYEHLQDEESQRLLVDVMSYRILGHRKVKLPLNTPSYWKTLDDLERKADTSDPIDVGFFDWKLDRYNLTDEGYPIQVHARALNVFIQWLLQHYRCLLADQPHIEARPGETVIDAGGCYGHTALYFAHQVGEAGQVFSFEFMPDNIRIFRRNLVLNPSLAACIKIVSNPLWSASGESLFVAGSGPATRVKPSQKCQTSSRVDTVCIDDVVQRYQLAHIDFIKMDIEGAELEALKGAEATIRRDRPKLAISVYHKLHDFWTIPKWLDALGLDYRFYLRHFTIHAEETVLFAETATRAISGQRTKDGGSAVTGDSQSDMVNHEAQRPSL